MEEKDYEAELKILLADLVDKLSEEEKAELMSGLKNQDKKLFIATLKILGELYGSVKNTTEITEFIIADKKEDAEMVIDSQQKALYAEIEKAGMRDEISSYVEKDEKRADKPYQRCEDKRRALASRTEVTCKNKKQADKLEKAFEDAKKELIDKYTNSRKRHDDIRKQVKRLFTGSIVKLKEEDYQHHKQYLDDRIKEIDKHIKELKKLKLNVTIVNEKKKSKFLQKVVAIILGISVIAGVAYAVSQLKGNETAKSTEVMDTVEGDKTFDFDFSTPSIRINAIKAMNNAVSEGSIVTQDWDLETNNQAWEELSAKLDSLYARFQECQKDENVDKQTLAQLSQELKDFTDSLVDENSPYKTKIRIMDDILDVKVKDYKDYDEESITIKTQSDEQVEVQESTQTDAQGLEE